MQHTKNQLATQVLSIVVLVMCCMISPTALASAPPIAAVTFSPDGAKVVAVSQRGLQIFSWPQLKRERIVAISFANLHCAAFSPNGQLLAVGGGDPAEDGAAQIFTWPALKPVATLGGHTDSVRSLAWLGNHGVVSASIDREIRVWDLATLAPRAVFRGHSRSVDAICFVEDGKTLVSSGVDQSLRVWDVESGELLRNLSQHTKPVNSLALRPRGEGLPMVASAAKDRTIRFWQPTIGRMVRYIRLEAEPLDIAWIDQGSVIVAACADGKVRFIDPTEVEVRHTEQVTDGWAYTVAAHPKDRKIVVGGSNGQLRAVDLPQLPR